MTDTSDHDELVRLAGEQALLFKTLCDLNSDFQRDLLALCNLHTDIAFNAHWHDKGVSLLNRIRDRQLQIANHHQRLVALAKVTGIS